jgi:hypothetical protein
MVHVTGGGRFRGALAICAVRSTYFRLSARARSPALHGAYHYPWNSSTEGVRPCVLRALAFEYWDVGSLFLGASAKRTDANWRRCDMSPHSGSSGGIRLGDFLSEDY